MRVKVKERETESKSERKRVFVDSLTFQNAGCDALLRLVYHIQTTPLFFEFVIVAT